MMFRKPPFIVLHNSGSNRPVTINALQITHFFPYEENGKRFTRVYTAYHGAAVAEVKELPGEILAKIDDAFLTDYRLFLEPHDVENGGAK